MLIVIDGLDASGKSTQAEMLAKYLKTRGKTYVLRSHPSEDNFFGVKGRDYLFVEGKKAHIAASLFYLVDVIRSIILYGWRRVDYVIFVRYLLGTAYLPTPIYKFAYHFFARIVPTRGSLIYLNVSPAEAFRRVVNNRIKTERFETIDELSKTADKAMDLVSDGKWVVLDGDRSIPEIHKDILRATGVK
jgi:dTMP kinase